MPAEARRALRFAGPWWLAVTTRPVLAWCSMMAGLAAMGGAEAAVPHTGAPVALVVVAVATTCIWCTGRRSAIEIDDTGVTDRGFFRHRHWTWDEVAVIARGAFGGLRGSPTPLSARYLMVCVRNDPYPHTLKGLPCQRPFQAEWYLDQIERAGWPVDHRSQAPDVWWVHDPRRTEPPG